MLETQTSSLAKPGLVSLLHLVHSQYFPELISALTLRPPSLNSASQFFRRISGHPAFDLLDLFLLHISSNFVFQVKKKKASFVSYKLKKKSFLCVLIEKATHITVENWKSSDK